MADILKESTFWYFVARKTKDVVGEEVADSIRPMNRRAREIGIPVEWTTEKSVLWATISRLFVLSQQKIGDHPRRYFESYRKGASAIIRPREAFDKASGRISDNISTPAIRGRSAPDSVADTFAVAASSYTVPNEVADRLHRQVLEVLVTDEIIHQHALLAVAPDSARWQIWETDYLRRRPTWWRRFFTNPDTWLFDTASPQEKAIDTSSSPAAKPERNFGCPSCRDLPDSLEALPFDSHATLYDRSHLSYSIRSCEHCGQPFLERFKEIVDWSGRRGRDDM